MSDCATQTGFVIDEVPGQEDQYMWALLDPQGTVLALSPRAYESIQDAQVAIAECLLAAREGEVPSNGHLQTASKV